MIDVEWVAVSGRVRVRAIGKEGGRGKERREVEIERVREREERGGGGQTYSNIHVD